eukprot:CAMPEP_0203882906 /NCGR_PEP_ID=MMETSP0359-20131031/27056_1 /ASSEMBLY_ACC=CAM_ASM_000338 /TAXON_ID=268821 /ORGANISM="Scrippsiella Hangoei, Strain SHTV-5" /LENGTH=41 /DNA_ID= /DNA_START= /DNA_END= /DNA_ORIENTATION=
MVQLEYAVLIRPSICCGTTSSRCNVATCESPVLVAAEKAQL